MIFQENGLQMERMKEGTKE